MSSYISSPNNSPSISAVESGSNAGNPESPLKQAQQAKEQAEEELDELQKEQNAAINNMHARMNTILTAMKNIENEENAEIKTLAYDIDNELEAIKQEMEKAYIDNDNQLQVEFTKAQQALHTLNQSLNCNQIKEKKAALSTMKDSITDLKKAIGKHQPRYTQAWNGAKDVGSRVWGYTKEKGKNIVDYIGENPVKSLGYATGAYAGYRVLKRMFGWGKKSSQKTETKSNTTSSENNESSTNTTEDKSGFRKNVGNFFGGLRGKDEEKDKK